MGKVRPEVGDGELGSKETNPGSPSPTLCFFFFKLCNELSLFQELPS